MAPVITFARVDSDDWKDAWYYIVTEPVGDHYVAVTNWAGWPLLVSAVSRSDLGFDFREIRPSVSVSPGRTSVFDLRGMTLSGVPVPPAWPVIDPDMDYKLVAEFSCYNNGGEWRLGTGEENDYGPLFPRPVLGDLP